MDKETIPFETLNLIVSPCLCVKDGRIFRCNQAADPLMLPEGCEITPLLATGREEYAAFRGGSLYLTLNISGTVFGAEVERRGDWDFFLLEGPEETRELRALALAAADLREPLAGIQVSAEMLAREAGPEAERQTAALNRSMAQMLRVIGNMSAAAAGLSHQELVEITAVFREIFEKAQTLLRGIDLSLSYHGPEHRLYCVADTQELERAILNLLSNAAKFTPKGGSITASLTRQGRMLRLCVQDTGSGISDAIRGSVFRRYLRQPSIEDGRSGLGLGMVMVRSAASHHGGTVLMDRPPQGGTRVTMTIAIRQDCGTQLRSPLLRIDYAGERDHALMELSDVLPAEYYRDF